LIAIKIYGENLQSASALYVPLLPYLLKPVPHTNPGGGLTATERSRHQEQTKAHQTRQRLIKTHIPRERLDCEAL
jgi:hypothetical protein